MSKGVRRRIINKNGRQQIVRVRHLKEWNAKHERLPRGYVRRFKEVELKRPQMPDVSGVKQKMLDRFQMRTAGLIKGYDNQHFKKELDTALKESKVSLESDGTYQLGVTYENDRHPSVKLRYDPKQDTLTMYLRGKKGNEYAYK